MAQRIQCCIPFCRRTLKNDKGFEEWICQVHWRTVPRSLKARKARIRQIAKKRSAQLWRQGREGGGQFSPLVWKKASAARRLQVLIWERCKRAAIEAEAGI